MDLDVAHVIPAPPEAVAEVTLDPAYQRSLEAISSNFLSRRDVIDQQQRDDGTVVREIRCVLGIDLPGAARRFIGGREPSWREEWTYHPDALRWDWRIRPDVGARLLDAAGEMTFEACGEGTVRAVRGHIRFNVPIYGGRVEELVVRELSRSYEKEAEHLTRWLNGQAG